jgi:hypothetical protein
MAAKRKRKASGVSERSLANLKPWKPGQSGNKDGYPKTDPELVEAFRERTPTALAVLDKVTRDYLRGPYIDDEGNAHVPPKEIDAVKASEVLLNRAWGTAPATVKLEAAIKAEVKHGVAAEPIAIDPERAKRLVALLARSGVLIAGVASPADAEADEVHTVGTD